MTRGASPPRGGDSLEFSKIQIMRNKVEQIGGCIARDERVLDEWSSCEGFYRAPGVYERAGDWKPMELGAHWRCTDGVTRWFRTRFTLPEGWQQGRAVLELDFGGEALVRLNGRIQSAVTSYLNPAREQRTRVALPQGLAAGDAVDIELECALNYMEYARLRARGDRDVEYTLRFARAVLLDEPVERYYFDALVALEALEVLENPYDRVRRGNVKLPPELERFFYQMGKDTYEYERVKQALLASLALVDVDFGRQRVSDTVGPAARALGEALASIPSLPRAKVCFVGHSHIDTAWLWPVKETVRKAAKTFANALALMDQYPEHIFAHSQPWQYKQVKRYYPELFERIRQRVREGRWELIGNSWVEADANIPSGEALVRQLLYGRGFFMKEFGTCSDVYWMPDVFGYSWALPQIIKRSGMKYFYTSKLINNDVNRFPHTLFSWQGVDGTRIPAYLERVNYNGEIKPFYADFVYKNFDEKPLHDRLMVTFGYGDGGGGPSYQMLEHARRLKRFPGLPECEITRTEGFFEGIDAEELPVWNDEMYYEFHRGTYTSQADTKKNNRKGELLLRQAEIAASASALLADGVYPKQDIDESWELILLNQFHDIIPGSSIHDVYEDCKRDYARALSLGQAAQNQALAALGARINAPADSVVAYNFLSWERDGLVEVHLAPEQRGLAPEGAAYTLEEGEDGLTLRFVARQVPAMGYRSYRLVPAPAAAGCPVQVSARSLENGFYRLELNEQGEIARLYDKQAEREVLAPEGVGNRLSIFEDKPAGESAWNIDIEYQNKRWDMTLERIEVAEVSPVRGALRVVRSFNQSRVEQLIVLYAGSRRIDFETRCDWHETEKMLKAAFEVDILSSKATYEIAYGAIERPTHQNTSWDQAKFEVAAHKWGDLSEGGYGVSLLNDCKYGYDIQGHTMRLTLLRSPVYPDPVADKGEHQFTYSLLPHAGDWRQAGTVRAGYELNVPLVAALTEAHSGVLPEVHNLLDVAGESAVVEALKRSEDGEGYVLRLYESQGARGKVTIKVNLPLTRAWEANLMEQLEQPLAFSEGRLTLMLKPYEIKTVVLKP